MSADRRLILFTRYPIPGWTKTRLIPALGTEGAAALHRRLVLRTLRTARTLCQSHDVGLEVRFAGGSEQQMQHWLGDNWLCRPQGDGDLGQRMAHAFEDSFREGSRATVIIGSDCPGLTSGLLAEAFDRLTRSGVVFGPATDGGYYLVGLSGPLPQLFQNVPWGTDSVLNRSLEILRAEDIAPALLKPLDDLDRPGDLPHWQQIVDVEESDLAHVSVIIPALNETSNLANTIESVRQGSPHEIIVVDGGSTDGTHKLAQDLSALTLGSAPGRARQMNAGAARAKGNTLLFLHADTRLPHDWFQPVVTTLGQPGVAAGAFRFQIRGHFRFKSLTEITTNWRSRWFQMPYGDQGLFVRRALFEELGGYSDLPIMEDFDLVRRLHRCGRMVTLGEAASTSGRRWEKLGFARTTMINHAIIVGYHLGIPTEKLVKFYRNAR